MEQGLEELEMGLAGPRRGALLVGRRRQRFPAEGVKEQVGGLVVGGKPLPSAQLLAEGMSVYTLN